MNLSNLFRLSAKLVPYKWKSFKGVLTTLKEQLEKYNKEENLSLPANEQVLARYLPNNQKLKEIFIYFAFEILKFDIKSRNIKVSEDSISHFINQINENNSGLKESLTQLFNSSKNLSVVKDESVLGRIALIFAKEWQSIEKIARGRSKLNPETQLNIYNEYIGPYLFEKTKRKIPFSTFKALMSVNKEAGEETGFKNLFSKFSESLFMGKDENGNIVQNSEPVLSEEGKAIRDKIVEVLMSNTDSEFSNRIYNLEETPKSYHEFIVKDILYILGIPFRTPTVSDLNKYIIDSSHLDKNKSFEYSETPIPDLEIDGEIVELFGDIKLGDYEKRKFTKMNVFKHFWFIDFNKNRVNETKSQRKMISYAIILDKNACLKDQSIMPNSNGMFPNEYGLDSIACGRSLQGRDYQKGLEDKIPLLKMENFSLCESYLVYLDKLKQSNYLQEVRNKLKEVRDDSTLKPVDYTSIGFRPKNPTELHANSNKINKIAEQPIDTVSIRPPITDIKSFGKFPSLEEISKSLSSLYRSSYGWSPQEKVAVYFKTPERINYYITKMNSLSNTNLELNASSKWNFKLASVAFDKKVKDIIKQDIFFKKLFKLYDIDMSLIDKDLKFIISDLDGRYAKSKDNKIYINKVLTDKEDFFPEGLHFIVHEMTHWLTRQKEKDCYFMDDEEIKGFAIGIAWQIAKGKQKEEIRNVYLPIINGHFKDNKRANKLFETFHKHALKLSKYLT